jgi:hypothetical protein
MRKIFLVLGIILLLGFIILQFFQPEKNKSDVTQNHIFEQEQVPVQIQTLMTEACLDCHSNNTRYLWYHNISPVSWMIKNHVDEGKDELNLSNWAEMDVFEKITMLEEICQETERKTMPLESYRTLHPKAKLSEEQIATLCSWTSKLSEELLAKAMEN